MKYFALLNYWKMKSLLAQGNMNGYYVVSLLYLLSVESIFNILQRLSVFLFIGGDWGRASAQPHELVILDFLFGVNFLILLVLGMKLKAKTLDFILLLKPSVDFMSYVLAFFAFVLIQKLIHVQDLGIYNLLFFIPFVVNVFSRAAFYFFAYKKVLK